MTSFFRDFWIPFLVDELKPSRLDRRWGGYYSTFGLTNGVAGLSLDLFFYGPEADAWCQDVSSSLVEEFEVSQKLAERGNAQKSTRQAESLETVAVAPITQATTRAGTTRRTASRPRRALHQLPLVGGATPRPDARAAAAARLLLLLRTQIAGALVRKPAAGCATAALVGCCERWIPRRWLCA